MLDAIGQVNVKAGAVLTALLELFPLTLRRTGHSILQEKDMRSSRQYVVLCRLDALRAGWRWKGDAADREICEAFSAEITERHGQKVTTFPCRVNCVAGAPQNQLYLVLMATDGKRCCPGTKIESFLIRFFGTEAEFRVTGTDGSCELMV